MKKKKHIGLWILSAIVVLIAALVIRQRQNLKAVVDGVKYSPEEILQKLEENEAALEETILQDPDISVREPTQEELDQLGDGELTEEELIGRLTEGASELLPYQKQLSELLAAVYAMQAEYNNTLESMLERAKQEYSAKTEAEKSKSALVKWAREYISQASELEKACDSRMDEIVSRLSRLIKDNNGDSKLVDQVIEVYSTEKSLKKSWYLSQMQKRGLLG